MHEIKIKKKNYCNKKKRLNVSFFFYAESINHCQMTTEVRIEFCEATSRLKSVRYKPTRPIHISSFSSYTCQELPRIRGDHELWWAGIETIVRTTVIVLDEVHKQSESFLNELTMFSSEY